MNEREYISEDRHLQKKLAIAMATLKASSSSDYMLKMMLVAVVIMMISAGAGTRRAVVEAADCGDQIKGLVKECTKYVLFLGPKKAPSQDCCDVVKQADQDCVCSRVTHAIEAFISMKKALYVAYCCGRSIPSGTQCGSYTVPAKY